jgi:predicted DsbA family dithiol-disulfide isomerase
MIVDLVHDVVCPWCRIGYANLKTAAKSFPDDPLTVRLRPFFLDPNIPDGGIDFKARMTRIAGSDDFAPMFERVIEAGKAAGLTFHFDRILKYPNSSLAHQAILAVPEADRERFLEAFHTAYFEDGRDIGEREVVLAIASEIGLDPRAVGAALSYPQWREMVSEQAKQIATDGVKSVPFFVMNDSLSLAGAYPAPQLVQAWTKAQEIATETQATAPAEPAPVADSTAEPTVAEPVVANHE